MAKRGCLTAAWLATDQEPSVSDEAFVKGLPARRFFRREARFGHFSRLLDRSGPTPLVAVALEDAADANRNEQVLQQPRLCGGKTESPKIQVRMFFGDPCLVAGKRIRHQRVYVWEF
jgi:hypothetical protein